MHCSELVPACASFNSSVHNSFAHANMKQAFYMCGTSLDVHAALGMLSCVCAHARTIEWLIAV